MAASTVTVHPAFTRKVFVTQCTLIGLLSRMDPHVSPQVTFDFKGSGAKSTAKGSLPCMRSNVVFQAEAVNEYVNKHGVRYVELCSVDVV